MMNKVEGFMRKYPIPRDIDSPYFKLGMRWYNEQRDEIQAKITDINAVIESCESGTEMEQLNTGEYVPMNDKDLKTRLKIFREFRTGYTRNMEILNKELEDGYYVDDARCDEEGVWFDSIAYNEDKKREYQGELKDLHELLGVVESDEHCVVIEQEIARIEDKVKNANRWIEIERLKLKQVKLRAQLVSLSLRKN